MSKLEEALEQARSWRDVALTRSEDIGYIYPRTPPISYEMLDELIGAIDGDGPKGVSIPMPKAGVAGSTNTAISR